jgi:hypothetical protein
MELRVANKYRLGRKIGSGSFGDIYLGGRLLRAARADLSGATRVRGRGARGRNRSRPAPRLRHRALTRAPMRRR